jgi:Cu2+-exporting ATPase
MLTGDNETVAAEVATELGVTDYHAELRPDDKLRYIDLYRKSGQVMMVGDGVNDAPSLAKADIGVAIGAGTQVAMDAADVILVSSDLGNVVSLIDLARASNRKMKQNLWWGAGYNLIALPLAAGMLIPFGFQLSPMVGAVVMSLSTIIVALNAMSLK